MRRLIAIFLAIVVSGESRATPLSDATRQLEQAEKLWTHVAPQAYSYSVKYSAFILQYGCELQHYRVNGPHSVPRSESNCKPRPDILGSVPALFRLVHKLLGQGYDDIDMSFDPVLGYPKSIYVGVSGIHDAYFQFEVSGFNSDQSNAPPNNRWRGP